MLGPAPSLCSLTQERSGPVSRKPQVGLLPGMAHAVSSAWHCPALSPNQAGPPPRHVPIVALIMLAAPWFCGTSQLVSASWVQLNCWTRESHSGDRLGKSCQRRLRLGLEGGGDGNSRSKSMTVGHRRGKFSGVRGRPEDGWGHIQRTQPTRASPGRAEEGVRG